MAKKIKQEIVFDPNPLFYDMGNFIVDNKHAVDPETNSEGVIMIFNEGSSRSSKTWDAFHLIVKMCDENKFVRNPLIIYVVRKTLKSCREIAFKTDFKTCLKTIGIWDDKNCYGENQSPIYNLWGNEIRFVGMDGDEELGWSDIIFFNELLDIDDENRFKDSILRCKKIVIGDWNPKYTYHWVFKWEGRFNVLFTKTTFRNNKHLDVKVKNTIMESCPWDFSDYDEELGKWKHDNEEDRPVNERNLRNGTINKRRWLVYGEGERCPEDGAIYTNYEWIDKFPEDGLDDVAIGCDFGFENDPTALVRVGRSGYHLYIDLMTYENTPTAVECFDLIRFGLKEEQIRSNIDELWVHCDSQDKNRDDESYVVILNQIACERNLYWNFVKTQKKGITFGIGVVKSFNLHFVKNPNMKIELENYIWKIIEGRQTNIPIDKNNHALDALRYAVVDNYLDLVDVYKIGE